MNYNIQAQLLAEGFKREQILHEDWEALKKELADLYVAGKITERQISTRLSKAGMGGLARNAAYKIAQEYAQKREENLQKAKAAEEKLQRVAAKHADPNYGKTRGSLAQEYCNMWNKKFGNIVKAGVVKEEFDRLMDKYNVICTESERVDIFGDIVCEIIEEVNINGELSMINEENELATEKQSKKFRNIDKVKKGIRNTAIGLGVGAALAAAPGVVGGVKNVKAQNAAREQAKQEYQMSQDEINKKQNEMAKNLHDTGVEFSYAAKDLAGKSKEELKKLYEKGKITASQYKEALKDKIGNLKEDVNYFPY